MVSVWPVPVSDLSGIVFSSIIFSSFHACMAGPCCRVSVSGFPGFVVYNTFYAYVSPPRFDCIDSDMYPTEH